MISGISIDQLEGHLSTYPSTYEVHIEAGELVITDNNDMKRATINLESGNLETHE